MYIHCWIQRFLHLQERKKTEVELAKVTLERLATLAEPIAKEKTSRTTEETGGKK
ncbi:MAG: hypothetical protein ACQESR_16905 [Planctomycetota bacterium]